ncbi:MAG: DUF5305 domain-containing protein [Woeseiaceae bacterium]|nr:DUF5305 domain-containing protein [Woeseiaceae bacterium]
MQYVLVIVSLLGVAAIIWYFFMLPLGSERHERELELIRRKLERRGAQQHPADQAGPSDRGSDAKGASR